MKYFITNILAKRKKRFELELMFGEDWNQNTKAKRERHKK